MALKYDQGKPMVDLIIPEFVLDVAKVLTSGAEKYGVDNWKKGKSKKYRQKLLGALYRHTLAYHQGEKRDKESGVSHLCHIVCNAMFLYWHDLQDEKREQK